MRDAELQVLREQFARSTRGKGGVVLVSGPLGSGKTALLHAFVEQVGTAARVISAVASRAEQALPLGVVDQLLRGANLPMDRVEEVGRLLAHGALDASTQSPATPFRTRLRPALLHGFLDALRSVSADRPLVVVVDDLQYIDPSSLSCLLYLVRRLRTQRTLVVMSECTHNPDLRRLIHSEILQLAHCRQIRLSALPEPGVTAMLHNWLDAATADRVTTSCAAITGGSPLLLRAIAEDFPAGLAARSGPVAGPTFTRTVMSCLFVAEPSLLDVAHAVAVLEGSATVPMIGELLEVDHRSVSDGIDILTGSGLLEDGQFRHEAALITVQHSMPAALWMRLHRRAADILYADGASMRVVAHHLAAGREAGTRWARGALLDGARMALQEGDSKPAITYLRLAHDKAQDPRERAEICAALATAQWRISPTSAKRHLPELRTAVRAGLLTPDEATCLIAQLIWQGRYTDVNETLADLRSQQAKLVDVELLAEYSRALVPGLAIDAHRQGSAAKADALSASDRDSSGGIRWLGDRPGALRRAVNALTEVMRAGPHARPLAEAQQVLHGIRPAVDMLLPAVGALLTLICGDRSDLAAHDCDLLLKDDRVRANPSWRALLSVVRAGAGARVGELPEAEEQINTALALLPASDWAAAIAAPLATGIRATTAMGLYDSAAMFVDCPVPDEAFATVFGPEYLSARGHFHLACGRADAALEDFRSCRELLRGWSLDRPTVVPWRTDMAEALLSLGIQDQARTLAEEQLALVGSTTGRTRGITLRVLAATREAPERVRLLHEAVEELERSGDRLSLARAHLDLSVACDALGQPFRAHHAASTARRLAEQCDAQPLLDRLPPVASTGQRADAQTADEVQEGGLERLTDAEHRVAVLAARGHTNLQISHRLYITVSTVEQHLTRVYRKLGVSRRSQLKEVVGNNG